MRHSAEDGASDAGYAMVLDNRRLIVAFALLVFLCGSFFVIGFVEGKRQGIQSGMESAASEGAAPEPETLGRKELQPEAANARQDPMEEISVREQLDWYKLVNKREDENEKAPEHAHLEEANTPSKRSASAGLPASDKVPRAGRERASLPPVPSYSVQVGAFRQQRDAEAKAEALKAQGYPCFVEPSNTPDQLFLLKVGRYDTRADAVAMQLRLKRDGFATFIKTN